MVAANDLRPLPFQEALLYRRAATKSCLEWIPLSAELVTEYPAGKAASNYFNMEQFIVLLGGSISGVW